ncbi:YggS family pyridoxal phosphate-dependent enzyme [Candidatus Woesearchaeota archaeon]|nr:YggS family pyridoxal phosphate-dependent enzyme [Candidatus Woesearchaeota archaeon]
MSILKNLKRIRSEIGRDVKLVVVTKNCSIREINQALFLDVGDIGESKVQEAKEKKPLVKGTAKWHLIGHLQTNKVKKAVELFDMIQSVDSLKLAKKIDSVCASKNKRMSVLIQVNISREAEKHGVLEEDLEFFLEELSGLKNIQVLGLMAMAPFVEPEKTRAYFHKMKLLFQKLKKEKIPYIQMKYLSMGMTNDYKVAVEEGANMIRIGTAIFHSN